MATQIPQFPPRPDPLHVALVDPRTGMMTQPWQDYFARLDAVVRALQRAVVAAGL